LVNWGCIQGQKGCSFLNFLEWIIGQTNLTLVLPPSLNLPQYNISKPARQTRLPLGENLRSFSLLRFRAIIGLSLAEAPFSKNVTSKRENSKVKIPESIRGRKECKRIFDFCLLFCYKIGQKRGGSGVPICKHILKPG